MARRRSGPANDPMAMLQQQIEDLTRRVRELETKRVLAAPTSNLDKTRDPVDGETFVDHRDGSAMWRFGDEWRYGVPIASIAILPQLVEYEPSTLDRDWQALELGGSFNFRSSECFYLDEDFPTRMYVRTPGTYMTLMYAQMSNVDDYHGYADIQVIGSGRTPDDVVGIGTNQWFATSRSKQSSGDPMLDETIPPGSTSALTYMGITSFWDNSEEALDIQYEEDNPDDDEEVPYPSYTRWFEALIWNDGPDAWTLNASILTILRMSNRQLS